MDTGRMWEDFAALPAEAQKQVADFVAFLRQRYQKQQTKKPAKITPLEQEPFIGMWSNRADMNEEIARRGKELYEQQIRALVDNEENRGKIVSIDIETGDFSIDDDLFERQKVYTPSTPAQQSGANVLAMMPSTPWEVVRLQGWKSDTEICEVAALLTIPLFGYTM
ncbi:MAG TPA: hypothetical protein VFA07_01870 [Chthonomonadaceae bacterium]|nr:hypothetical protein [Chthonomonadaceae bacterium]